MLCNGQYGVLILKSHALTGFNAAETLKCNINEIMWCIEGVFSRWLNHICNQLIYIYRERTKIIKFIPNSLYFGEIIDNMLINILGKISKLFLQRVKVVAWELGQRTWMTIEAISHLMTIWLQRICGLWSRSRRLR